VYQLRAAERPGSGFAAPEGYVPLSVPEIRGNEWKYVRECLDTGWVSSVGRFVERFEGAVAEAVGARHAVATVNGTAALHVALMLAGVEPGDEVLVSTLTFIAPVNAIRYVGAWPVFVDARESDWQMDPNRVAAFLHETCERRGELVVNRATGRRVRAILPVHILGHPVDMDPILGVAREFGLPVIEDSTEALGVRYRGRAVGRLGQIACFSFNGNKIITTGGGGMIVTDDDVWADRARYLTTQAKDDPVEYVHGAIGYNYRLTNVQAALGVAQMEQLDEYVEAKRHIAAAYDAALAGVSGITPLREPAGSFSTYWMYTVRVDAARFGLDSRELLRRLEESGVQTRPLWQPIHLSAPHRTEPPADCPVAETLHREGLSLPCSVGLSREDQETVFRTIAAIGQETRHSCAQAAPMSGNSSPNQVGER
jgi:perosamine synthetase